MNTFFFDDVQYPEGLFGGKDFFNPIIYSTEEREVGVWIDNKPLYAKSFTLSSQITVSASSWTNTDLSLSDVEKFVNGYAISDDGTFQGSVVVDKSNDVIQLQSTRSSASYVKYLTVFYTKTTDTAGSASYTTLGVPAHHYDSNEKVVGTWFGETLYEKTFQFNQQVITDNAWTNNILGTVGSGIEIVDYNGMFGLQNTAPCYANFNYYRSSSEFFTAYLAYTSDDINVRPNMNAGLNVTLDKCTIWYTKTTT